MATRQNKTTSTLTTPPPQEGTPKIEGGVQDHHFGTQFAFDVNKSIGKLETGLENIGNRLNRVEAKLDQVQIDLASLKTSSNHMESLMGTMAKALWAIAGSLGVAALSLFGVWLKHKMGW